MQTRHGFHEQLRDVRTNVLHLAALAREAVTAATEALLAGETGTVDDVLRADAEIGFVASSPGWARRLTSSSGWRPRRSRRATSRQSSGSSGWATRWPR